jgi:D-alanyl-lipoteichoic acid acyltransferase DltB (MBOAT superfamily)
MFTSVGFLAFVGVVATVHWLAPARARTVWLLFASACFYGYGQPWQHDLILASIIVFGYAFGRALERAPEARRMRLLALGIAVELATLVWTRYWTGAPPPLGISFFTFTSLSYLIDVALEAIPAQPDFIAYALYVAFFPQMLAGPIARATKLLPQIAQHASKPFSYEDFAEGLRLVLWGFVQKLVVADRLAAICDPLFEAPSAAHGLSVLVPVVLLPFQIYYDFAGYTNIARGAALVFGIRLLPNFNRPYGATSLTDFWRRWHMSLYGWLTDYVYTPMTMACRGLGRYAGILGLWVTFLLSGVWHGTRVTYIAWAALHAMVLSFGVFARKRSNTPSLLAGWLRRARLLLLFCVADVIFRARTVADAFVVLRNSIDLHPRAQLAALVDTFGRREIVGGLLLALLVLLGDLWPGKDTPRLLAFPTRPKRWLAYAVAFWIILYFGRLQTHTFMYEAF